MIGIAARTLQAYTTRGHTEIVQPFAAARAAAATRPRVNQTLHSLRHTAGFRSRGDHRAIGLMAQSRGQFYTALAHEQTLAASQIEVTVPYMHVAVAYTAVLELEQHLAVLRFRHLPFRLLEGLAPFDDIVAQHIETIP